MTEYVASLIGIGAGLAVALFANLALLPRVLEAQRKTHARAGGGGDIDRVTRITTLAYRLAFPLVAGVVGYDLGTRLWGLMQ